MKKWLEDASLTSGSCLQTIAVVRLDPEKMSMVKQRGRKSKIVLKSGKVGKKTISKTNCQTSYEQMARDALYTEMKTL